MWGWAARALPVWPGPHPGTLSPQQLSLAGPRCPESGQVSSLQLAHFTHPPPTLFTEFHTTGCLPAVGTCRGPVCVVCTRVRLTQR